MKAVQTSKLAAERTVGTRHDREVVLPTALPSLDMDKLVERLATSPKSVSEAAWSRRVVMVAKQHGKGMAFSRPITWPKIPMTAESSRQQARNRGRGVLGRCHGAGCDGRLQGLNRAVCSYGQAFGDG